MNTKESENTQEKERPAGSQSLFRGLMLIEILSNYPNGCPLAHLSELAGLNKSTVHRLLRLRYPRARCRELPLNHKIYRRRPKSADVAEYHPRCRAASGSAEPGDRGNH